MKFSKQLPLILTDSVSALNAVKPSDDCQASKFSKQLPFIKPVEILQVSSSGKQYCDESLGLSIDIPQGAVPESSLLHLEVGMCLYGPFKFPTDLCPIAPILMLCSRNDITLHKDIQITLPHNIIFDDTNNTATNGIKVIKANHRSLFETGESVFNNIVQHCDILFCTQNSFGLATFSLRSFSFVTLFADRDNFEVARQRGYCVCPLFPLPSAHPTVSLTFYLCVTYFMKPCLEVSIIMNIIFIIA